MYPCIFRKMKKTIVTVLCLLLGGCASQDGTAFGRKADVGLVLGGMTGAIVGAHNGNPLKGALIGSVVGLGAGAVADTNDQRQRQPLPVAATEPQILADVVVVDSIPPNTTPVVIEYRTWSGGYYHPIRFWGYRDRFGRVYRRR